jgi:uncharacterized protein YbjT (DUF2867 family)
MAKKLIAVVGATGSQGGGLVRAILADPSGDYAVRALTRDPSTAAAKQLAAAGAEVVAFDIDDPDSINRGFKDAWGAYCVTFFWNHMSPEREVVEAGYMAKAAAGNRLQHVIWSTLEDTRRWVPLDDPRMPTLLGKYKVPHFDAKGSSDHLFAEAGAPTTNLLTSFYWDNFIKFDMGPKPGPDGVLGVTFPMGEAKLPGIVAEDIGRCAFGIFKRPDLIGKTVGIAVEHITGHQIAAAFARHLGQEVRYNSVTPDMFRSFGFPGADDLGNMFQFKRDFEKDFCAARDIGFSRSLCPDMQNLDQWIAANWPKTA